MPNTCWDCKYNTVKMKILVPYNRTIKEYVHRTGDFQSDIVAIVKEKPGQYTVWFRTDDAIKLISFKLMHICQFKHEKTKKETRCPRYAAKLEKTQISNIIYSKTMPQE